jgi:peptidylprolyl isomerase
VKLALRLSIGVALITLAVFASGCSSGGGSSSTATARKGVVTSPTRVLAPTVVATPQTLPDGLGVIDLKVGSGAAAVKGQKASIDYTLYGKAGLAGGTMGGPPLTVTIGAGSLLKGIDEGIETMHVGGKRRLIIPPALGFGATGFTDSSGLFRLVGPNETLIVDVTLLSAG